MIIVFLLLLLLLFLLLFLFCSSVNVYREISNINLSMQDDGI
jgi:uncharacterized protein (DUF58 family)